MGTRLATGAFDEPFARVPRRRTAGRKRSEARGDRRGKEEREDEHWNADRDAIQPRQIRRRQREESRHASERSQHAQAAAHQREQKRLGQELTDQPSARRAKRASHGELALSDGKLRQQGIRHVRARDQQQEPHRPQQDQQRRAGLTCDRGL